MRSDWNALIQDGGNNWKRHLLDLEQGTCHKRAQGKACKVPALENGPTTRKPMPAGPENKQKPKRIQIPISRQHPQQKLEPTHIHHQKTHACRAREQTEAQNAYKSPSQDSIPNKDWNLLISTTRKPMPAGPGNRQAQNGYKSPSQTSIFNKDWGLLTLRQRPRQAPDPSTPAHHTQAPPW